MRKKIIYFLLAIFLGVAAVSAPAVSVFATEGDGDVDALDGSEDDGDIDAIDAGHAARMRNEARENENGMCGSASFFGLYPWYQGLVDSSCEVKEVVLENATGDQVLLRDFVWTIAGNISSDIFLVIGILAVGYTVYGGYLYIISDGDLAKATKARKTITSALVGMGIALVATAFIRFLMSVLAP